ncbi:MAG: DUF4126 domain-containing protein [Gammaproteobacteria bacterium]|nr:DUF4126 domain-containing protein [Gammaproteobacteria bacterium]
MEAYEGLIQTIALTMGVAWASGINLYGTLVALGVMMNMGYVDLPPDLQVVGDPLVIAAAGFMYVVEFFADKIPGVDTGWDTLHTLVRIPAGALLAAGAIGEVGAGAEIAAAIVGGSIAAGTHFTKAGTRVLINTSPEPFSNWTASVTEDIAVFAGLWAALQHPVLFLVLLVLFLLLIIWLLPKLFRAIKKVMRFFINFFSGKKEPEPSFESAIDQPKPPTLTKE